MFDGRGIRTGGSARRRLGSRLGALVVVGTALALVSTLSVSAAPSAFDEGIAVDLDAAFDQVTDNVRDDQLIDTTPSEAEQMAESLEEEYGVSIDRTVVKEIAKNDFASFWVVLDSEADLSGAKKLNKKAEKARFVLAAKTRHAAKTQAALHRFLDGAGAEYTSYWISNALLVTGDADLLAAIAHRAEVKSIEADKPLKLPEPEEGTTESNVNGIEWNVDRINAPQVWSEYGVRGEGIVIASIDTGVEYTHPALVSQYRGNNGDGTFTHVYNWFDPTLICPDTAPCDNNGHGTHTVGTMVGDDGAGNQIGVAPGATWIAAKGCESGSCSATSLLASGEWVLAPTDQNGENPRPDLAPDVVNNSWGGAGGDFWYQDMVDAWIAAGIFPSFANGNTGPNCGTASSPGDYQSSYGSGAFNVDNQIADFSSRGPGVNGEIKPNIAAPGVNVRSSYPDGGYSTFSGTSMATPHTTAAVALLWSARPLYQGDVAATREILDSSAIDVNDTTCGGTAADNNVWGEGRLDALAAIEQAPTGDLGAAAGLVATGREPLAGATVTYDGPLYRATTTGEDGAYSFDPLMVGDYAVTVEKFGYETATGTVTVVKDETITADFTLAVLPTYRVTGTVADDDGNGIAGATVTISAPFEPATTDQLGRYAFPTVPAGTYALAIKPGDRCVSEATEQLVVNGNESFDVTLGRKNDNWGYRCYIQASSWVDATGHPVPFSEEYTATSLGGTARLDLPFKFPFYGSVYTAAYVDQSGYLTFDGSMADGPGADIPFPASPNAAIRVREYHSNAPTRLFARTVRGKSPEDVRFVIQWIIRSLHTERFAIAQVVLDPSGEILMQHVVDPDCPPNPSDWPCMFVRGAFATIGIENWAGTDGIQYSRGTEFNPQPVLTTDTAIRFVPPTRARDASGTVVDDNDGRPIAHATVTATRDGTTAQLRTGDDGGYAFSLPDGLWSLTFQKADYVTETRQIRPRRPLRVALRTARLADPGPIELTLPAGTQQTAVLDLTNTGALALEWRAGELSAPSGRQPGETIKEWLGPRRGGSPANRSVVQVPDGNLWIGEGADRGACGGTPFRKYNPDGVFLSELVCLQYAPGGPRFLTSDTAFDSRTGLVCATTIRLQQRPSKPAYGMNAIDCSDVTDGHLEARMDLAPWPGDHEAAQTLMVPGGLAYNPTDDTFYFQNVTTGHIYHVAGFSHPNPGKTLGDCVPAPVRGSTEITGLAYNPSMNVLWAARRNTVRDNDDDRVIVKLDPTDCTVLGTIPRPYDNAAPGAAIGLGLNSDGNLWMAGKKPQSVLPNLPWISLLESGISTFTDVPWLDLGSSSAGSVAPGSTGNVKVTIDATHRQPGTYEARIGLVSNAGRTPRVTIPVKVTVTGGAVKGSVVDANDQAPTGGATVTADNGTETFTTRADSDGGYTLSLPFGTWSVAFEKENYVTETREILMAPPDGSEVLLDVALRTGVATVEPDSLGTTLEAGEQHTFDVRLSNAGSADLSWQSLEQAAAASGAQATGGAEQPGELEWIQRSTTAITLQCNCEEGTARAHPSAARWTPAETKQNQPQILLYADDTYSPAPNTKVDQALRRLGLGYTAYYNGNFDGFKAALTQEDWDLVIFAGEYYVTSFEVLQLLNRYVTDGGKLIYYYWGDSDGSGIDPIIPLFRTLGVSKGDGESSAGDFWPPDPVYWWAPRNTAFTDPEAVPQVTDRTGDPRYRIYGGSVSVLPGFQALAGESETPTSGHAKLVLGNDDRTLYRAFSDGPNNADLDSDGVDDGVELWENFITGMVRGYFAEPIPWLDTSPASGSLSSGGSQELSVTVDTTGLTPGVYTAKVLLATSAGRQPVVRIPVRLEVTESTATGTAATAEPAELNGNNATTWGAARPV